MVENSLKQNMYTNSLLTDKFIFYFNFKAGPEIASSSSFFPPFSILFVTKIGKRKKKERAVKALNKPVVLYWIRLLAYNIKYCFCWQRYFQRLVRLTQLTTTTATLIRNGLTWKNIIKIPRKYSIEKSIKKHHFNGKKKTIFISFQGTGSDVTPLQAKPLLFIAWQVFCTKPKSYLRKQTLE